MTLWLINEFKIHFKSFKRISTITELNESHENIIILTLEK